MKIAFTKIFVKLKIKNPIPKSTFCNCFFQYFFHAVTMYIWNTMMSNSISRILVPFFFLRHLPIWKCLQVFKMRKIPVRLLRLRGCKSNFLLFRNSFKTKTKRNKAKKNKTFYICNELLQKIHKIVLISRFLNERKRKVNSTILFFIFCFITFTKNFSKMKIPKNFS